jgi:hypothetical protein
MTTVDMTKFDKAINGLVANVGESFQEVVRHEAGKILEAAIRFTPATKAQKIIGNVVTGKVLEMDGKKYWMDNRYPNALWRKLANRRKAEQTRQLRSRGLAKKSWFLLAVHSGLRVAAPGFVQKAQPTTGKSYPQNYSATEIKMKKNLYRLEMMNAQPTVQGTGKRALSRAIAGRIRYFEQNLRRGVFKDAAAVARAYPGLTVRK